MLNSTYEYTFHIYVYARTALLQHETINVNWHVPFACRVQVNIKDDNGNGDDAMMTMTTFPEAGVCDGLRVSVRARVVPVRRDNTVFVGVCVCVCFDYFS